MATAFLSGLNRSRNRVILKKLHNNFCMGRNEYPKTLTAPYYLVINYKGYTKGPSLTLNDGVAFTTKIEESDVHATYGMKMTRSGKSFICHIWGKNHYVNMCPDRDQAHLRRNQTRLRTTKRKKATPLKRQLM